MILILILFTLLKILFLSTNQLPQNRIWHSCMMFDFCVFEFQLTMKSDKEHYILLLFFSQVIMVKLLLYTHIQLAFTMLNTCLDWPTWYIMILKTFKMLNLETNFKRFVDILD